MGSDLLALPLAMNKLNNEVDVLTPELLASKFPKLVASIRVGHFRVFDVTRQGGPPLRVVRFIETALPFMSDVMLEQIFAEVFHGRHGRILVSPVVHLGKPALEIVAPK